MSERPDIGAGDAHTPAGVHQPRSAAWRSVTIALVAIAILASIVAVFAVTSEKASLRLLGWRLHVRDESRPLAVAWLATVGAILCSGRFRAAVSRRRYRDSGLVMVVLFVWVLAPVLGVTVRTVARHLPDTYPANDGAVTSLYAARALEGRLLVGPYSRFGWHHPGPLFFYLLAPAYAVTDHHEVSHKFTVACLTLLASAGIFWVASASGGRVMLFALAASVGLLAWRWPELTISAWNPHVVVLPLMFGIATAAAVLAGSISLLPALAFAATLVVQSHVGLVPAVGPLALAGGIAVARACFNRDVGLARRARSALNATAWMLALLWFPVAAEQAANVPGNLAAIATFFREHPPAERSVAFALGVVGRHVLGPFAPTLRLAAGEMAFDGAQPATAIAATGIVLVLLAGTAVAGYRARRPFLAWLAALCGASLLVAVWSVMRVVGDVANHVVFWIVAPGTVAVATLAASALGWASGWLVPRQVPGDVSARTRLPELGFASLVLIVLAAISGRALVHYHQREARDTVVRELFQDLRAFEEAQGTRAPLLAATPATWAHVSALLVQHVKARLPVTAEDHLLPVVGDWFRRTGREDGRFLVLRESEFQKYTERDQVTVVSRRSGMVVVETSLPVPR